MSDEQVENQQHQECAQCHTSHVCETCTVEVHHATIQVTKEVHSGHIHKPRRPSNIVRREIKLAEARMKKARIVLDNAILQQSNVEIEIAKLELKHAKHPKSEDAHSIAILKNQLDKVNILISDLTVGVDHWDQKLNALEEERDIAEAIEEENAE